MTRVDVLVRQSVARSTGATIQLLDQRDRGDDPENPWETVCVEHGGVCSHTTRELARSFMAAPEEWCAECGIATEGGVGE